MAVYRIEILNLDTGEEEVWTVTGGTAYSIYEMLADAYGPPSKSQLTKTVTTFPDGTGITLRYGEEDDEAKTT